MISKSDIKPGFKFRKNGIEYIVGPSVTGDGMIVTSLWDPNKWMMIMGLDDDKMGLKGLDMFLDITRRNVRYDEIEKVDAE